MTHSPKPRVVVAHLLVILLAGRAWAGEAPGTAEVFKGQILLNMAVAVISSPAARDNAAWRKPTEWVSTQKAYSVLVAVRISEPIIDAAVECWAAGAAQVTTDEKEKARAKLRRLFLRQGEKCFLIAVQPIRDVQPLDDQDDYDDWGLKVGPVLQNAKLVTLDRQEGNALRAEDTLDRALYATDKFVSCLTFLKDVIDEEADPCFSLQLSSVRHLLRSRGSWLEEAQTRTVTFRFETSDVRLLALLERGIPWKTIEAKYIKPHLEVVAARTSSGMGQFLRDVAASMVAGLILKLI